MFSKTQMHISVLGESFIWLRLYQNSYNLRKGNNHGTRTS